MRFSFFSQLLLALLFTTAVAAQGGTLVSSTPSNGGGDWFVEPLPEGAFVPDQLIVYYDTPKEIDPKDIIIEMANKGIRVAAESLTPNTVLITYLDGMLSLGACEGMTEEECMCTVIGNPGDGASETGSNGNWPNYYVSNGMPGTIAPNPQAEFDFVTDPFPNNQYDPMLHCDADVTIPWVELGDRTVDVAIFDTGIDVNKHKSFFYFDDEGSDRENGATFVQWHRVGSEPRETLKEDPNGHGTAIAYLVAHTFVNAGQQDQIRLHSYRVLNDKGRGTAATVIKAIDQATNDGMDIFNLSLGFIGLECDTAVQNLLSIHLERAQENNILSFVSAGNDGNSLTTKPQWPAAESDLPSVFTIGATTCGAYNRWELSNYNGLDFVAPGTNITVPFSPEDDEDTYILIDGTSFSTPIAAGLAASYFTHTDVTGVLCLLNGDPYLENTGSYDSSNGPINTLPNQRCQQVTSNGGTDMNENGTIVFGFGNAYNGRGIDVGSGIPGVIFPRGSVSPNPFNGTITVSTNYADEGNKPIIGLYNATGLLIQTARANGPTTTFDTNSLDKGIYYLRISDSEGFETMKIIKQ